MNYKNEFIYSKAINKVNMTIRIQYASDLHLDQLPSYKMSDLIQPKGDVLILGGDICHIVNIYNHSSFFRYVSVNFQYVIYVPGNHEFYSDIYSMKELEMIVKKFVATFTNVFYLDNSSIFIEDVLFTGSCLWCNPENEPPEWFSIDITKDEISDMYNNSVAYLNKISSLNYPKHVMITHYPPIYMEFKKRKNRSYHDHRYDDYYQNETIQLDNQPSVWIFGHTHENMYNRVKDTMYISNQRKDKSYNKEAILFV